MLSVDLNCDMGEGFGQWSMGSDAELMRFVSSANIACGFHAGDASVMRRTVESALRNEVAIGAHPGYPDLQGFGRRNIAMSASEVSDIVLYQVSALKGICEASGGLLHHVKPHGALYNQAAKVPSLAQAIVNAVRSIDPTLILYGLSGSSLILESRKVGLPTASEVFADRTYQADGSLTPRTEPDALITEHEAAVQQAVLMVENRVVIASDGRAVPIEPDTICIHGDGPHSLDFAFSINQALIDRGISISPPSR